MYLFNKKWNENPLLFLGVVVLVVWTILAILDLGIKNKDLQFALNMMCLSGFVYGIFLTIVGWFEYIRWKKDQKRDNSYPTS